MAKESSNWIIIFVIILSVILTTSYLNLSHSEDTITKIISATDVDNGDLKIDWSRYPTTDIELSESLNITTSGTYHLTGSLDDGEISIRTNSEGVVRLILDNATIKNSNGPAIACYEGDDLVIELIGESTISDGSSYTADYDEDVTGAIYSKADLSFTGDGTLNLTANYQDGIVSKDDLKFNSGTYYITAADDGIRGKDSVYVVSGDFSIKATADAIKATNEQTKGFVMIDDGNFNLTATAKGIKSVSNILIKNGNFVINTRDDAIHSNNYIGISDGVYNISAGDDGIHADRELIIDGGKITIAKSYEGLEAQAVTINGGNISIASTDDGINAGGGADSSANNRPGANPFNADEKCVLSINGGSLYINASGDGIDSNGWLYINDGNIVVDGPTNNGNGALDAGLGIVMNGGEAIAVGASGMAESLGQTSSINNISAYLSSTASSGTKITIKDSSNQTILEHTSAKSFNHIAFGSSSLKLGETYTLYLDDEKVEQFAISSITTTIGQNNATKNNAAPNGMGNPPASR